MKEYFILHPEQMNHFCDENVPQKEVAMVRAQNLGVAFVLAQNDWNPDYAELGIRSTSVGDIIVCSGVGYMVHGVGFKRLSHYPDLVSSPIDREVTEKEYDDIFDKYFDVDEEEWHESVQFRNNRKIFEPIQDLATIADNQMLGD